MEILVFPLTGMYQCFVSAGGSGIGPGRNVAGIAAAAGYRQEAQASSELRLGGKNFESITRHIFHFTLHTK